MKSVFILFDSLNLRALSCYGGPHPTPNFDRLANRGIRFTNHYAGSLPCMPARRDLQTGRYNFFHSSWGPMEPYDNSLPQLLHRHRGTHSHLVTDHFHYFEAGGAGYHSRFTTFEYLRGQEYDPWKAEVVPDTMAYQELYDPRHYDFTDSARGDHRVQHAVNRRYGIRDAAEYPLVRCVDAALEFVQVNHRTDNWFLQLECFDPHEPFDVPQEYLDRFGVREDRVLDWPHYRTVTETPQEVERVRARYAALVSFCDDQLGRVLDAMDRLALWEDTAVILTSDHGYLLGEHAWWAKTIMPNYQEISHVPLLVYHPNHRDSSSEGRQVRNCLTSAIDLMPTVLEMYGLPIPGEVCGESLVPRLTEDSATGRVVACGVFGGSCLVTDGRYAYHRFPRCLDSTDLWEYRLHPTHMRADFAVTELAGSELYHDFDFTQGAPVLRIKARDDSRRVPNHDALGFQDRGTRLFDLETDPGENDPCRDEAVERRLSDALREIMQRHDAPPEMYRRFELE